MDQDNHETWWTIAGTELADAVRLGRDKASLVKDLIAHRQAEYDNVPNFRRFAALAREVADAASKGRDLGPLLDKLAALRRADLGPPISDEQRSKLFWTAESRRKRHSRRS